MDKKQFAEVRQEVLTSIDNLVGPIQTIHICLRKNGEPQDNIKVELLEMIEETAVKLQALRDVVGDPNKIVKTLKDKK